MAWILWLIRYLLVGMEFETKSSMDTSTMWLILKLSSMDSEEFGYVTY